MSGVKIKLVADIRRRYGRGGYRDHGYRGRGYGYRDHGYRGRGRGYGDHGYHR
jgi:hypothetical protein